MKLVTGLYAIVGLCAWWLIENSDSVWGWMSIIWVLALALSLDFLISQWTRRAPRNDFQSGHPEHSYKSWRKICDGQESKIIRNCESQESGQTCRQKGEDGSSEGSPSTANVKSATRGVGGQTIRINDVPF
jgi:hypothetical protein